VEEQVDRVVVAQDRAMLEPVALLELLTPVVVEVEVDAAVQMAVLV
jgi:hypothetical protein